MIGSCLMIGLKGPSLLKEEKSFIRAYNISGVLLFKRNIQSFKQVYELCFELKSLAKPPLLIAIDMEGGHVNRLSHLTESIPWPSAKVLGTLKPSSVLAIAKALARQLRPLGIDINFAPVADLPLTANPLLETRVFGKSPKEILRGAGAFMEGLVKEKLIPCLKHFPGHGGTAEDSHKTLPKDQRSLEELLPQLKIFQALFEKYPCGIMTAHVEFPAIEKGPATFSPLLLKKQLRGQMGFKGFIVSDDIDMSALDSFSAGERFFFALKGGCNLVISCQKEETPRALVQYFQNHPEKEREIQEELIYSSKKIMEIRKNAKAPPRFKLAEKELAQLKSAVLSKLGSSGFLT